MYIALKQLCCSRKVLVATTFCAHTRGDPPTSCLTNDGCHVNGGDLVQVGTKVACFRCPLPPQAEEVVQDITGVVFCKIRQAEQNRYTMKNGTCIQSEVVII